MPSLIPLAQPQLSDDAITAATRVLRSGQLAQGDEVAAFEAEFARLLGYRHCVAVSSGTTGLWITLPALGVGPGDEVITTAFTFGATAAAIRLTGATVVFADIEPDTLCLDPDAVTAAITPRTAAIIPVHLYGHPASIDRITALAAQHGLAVVEDAAQAHAATLHGNPAGSFGTAGVLSFYATKNMTSIEGGMITTSDAELAQAARLLRNQGMSTPYHYEVVGTNARMNDVAAAVARAELTTLTARTAARRRNAARLDQGLASLPTISSPVQRPGARHVYHQYVIRALHGTDHRAQLQTALRHARIATAVHYPTPLHRCPAYRTSADLPHADAAAGQVLSLPAHPALTDSDLDRIIDALASTDTAPTRHAAVPLGTGATP